MNGNKTVKTIEVRTAEGALLAMLQIKETVSEAPEEKSQGNPPEEKPAGAGKNQDRESEPMMTDPQKGYLFRLLAEKGIENDAAYETLTKCFKVASLKEVTKFAASKEIERLLAEQKGGKNAH